LLPGQQAPQACSASDRKSRVNHRIPRCAANVQPPPATGEPVFVVSGDAAVRDSIAELVSVLGLRAKAFCSLDDWSASVHPESRGCLVLDAPLAELGARLSTVCSNRQVLLLVDRGDVPLAVSAIKLGASEVLEKPTRDERLLECIRRLAEVTRSYGIRT